MKKIVILLAGVCFMASSAFANPAATLTVVRTAVETAKMNASALRGIDAAMITAATAANPSLSEDLTEILGHITTVLGENDDVVNGMSKTERVKFLADLFAASVMTKTNYEVVERLFKGKPLQAVLGVQTGEDALDAANLAKMGLFLAEYKKALEAGDATADAAEKASQSVTKNSFQDFLEACGAASSRRRSGERG